MPAHAYRPSAIAPPSPTMMARRKSWRYAASMTATFETPIGKHVPSPTAKPMARKVNTRKALQGYRSRLILVDQQRRSLRPLVPRIAAHQLPAEVRIVADPEAGQVARDLHRPLVWCEQVQHER